MSKQENFFQLSPQGFENFITEELKQKKFVAKQVLDWVYQKKVFDFSLMTNLKKDLREILQERFKFEVPNVVYQLKAADHSTIKVTLELSDKKQIETVFMKEDRGVTICISSQVGCAQKCIFCATGKMYGLRNLQAHEIVGQIIALQEMLGDKFPENFRVVYMGMGEPLNNINQVFKSLEILTDSKGFNIGSRKITMSTSGVVKGIYRLADRFPQVQLAISLHTVDEQLRKKWVPNQKETVKEILQAARDFIKTTGRKITFELVLFGGSQVSTSKLNLLGKALKGIHCNVNAIPYNPIEDGPQYLTRPTHQEVEYFKDIMSKWHREITVRVSRGRDIQAACGQLAIKNS
ncbi:MAG: 23S rRNA (adenine(2503)-C(2))-methyltransferase RlmN [Candidatus Cloacimonetes bacterium]|nr:23S rRNA (adenine(2503)-C(2))-methyltransferase RlmN [Candidatus Cloacimonadota bacterium]